MITKKMLVFFTVNFVFLSFFAEARIVRSESRIVRSESRIVRSESRIVPSESRIVPSESKIVRSETGPFKKREDNPPAVAAPQNTGSQPVVAPSVSAAPTAAAPALPVAANCIESASAWAINMSEPQRREALAATACSGRPPEDGANVAVCLSNTYSKIYHSNELSLKNLQFEEMLELSAKLCRVNQ